MIRPRPLSAPPAAWNEARGLIWSHRKRLSLGLGLMLISRVAGMVLPASSKYLIDDVVNGRRADLLLPIALAVGAATLVQAVTSFALSPDSSRRPPPAAGSWFHSLHATSHALQPMHTVVSV